jgi:hypothetical protein
MGHPRHDEPLEVGEDSIERLALVRRRCGQRAAQCTRRNVGQHPQRLDVAEVIGHPVDDSMRLGAESLGIHRR